MSIRAEAHSDDYVYEVTFDAENWIARASDEDIIALAECGWGGDYPADAVVLFLEDTNADIRQLLRYCHATQGTRRAVGFECHVDPDGALSWVMTHRPSLADKLHKGA